MSKRLSPVLVGLTQDALLKAFWRKSALEMFLRQHHISENALAQWPEGQTKRDFIRSLWTKLLKAERGDDVILAMARSLAQMDYFPDLEQQEGARDAVARLRDAVSALDDAIQSARDLAKREDAARAHAAARSAAQQSLANLESRLLDMMPQRGTPAGGYAFERWFYDLAVHFTLVARTGYYAGGRQIDGAITIGGTTFLVECKFMKGLVGSPEIDIFMAKIESKARNTMGLFVAHTGFNEGAIRAASRHQTPMLLLDYNHIFSLILSGKLSLAEVVSQIQQHASQTGHAYLAVSEFQT